MRNVFLFLYVIIVAFVFNPAVKVFCESKFSLGVIIQPSLFIAPKELTSSPTLTYQEYQASLLNDLDGFGMRTNVFWGLEVSYFWKNNIRINFGFEYLAFVGKTPYLGRINCSEFSLNPVGKMEAELKQFQFPFSIGYFIDVEKEKNFRFYIEPSFNFNLFNVHVNSEDSLRGDFIFDRRYFRLGMGFQFGCVYKISKKLYVEGLLGLESPNIFLRENDDISTSEVESLIKSRDGLKEKLIFFIPLKFKLVYLF